MIKEVVDEEKLTANISSFVQFTNRFYLTTTDNKVYVLRTDWPQMGEEFYLGTSNNYFRPGEVDELVELQGATIVKICQGTSHSLALAADGHFWVWGDNTYGQLGLETNQTVVVKPRWWDLDENLKFANIFCTNNTSFGIDKAGEVYTWGALTQSENINYPTRVSLPERAVDIEAWNGHVVALLSTGYVLYWKAGLYETPQKCTSQVKNIEATNNYVFFLKNDGSIYYCSHRNSLQSLKMLDSGTYDDIYTGRKDDTLVAETKMGTSVWTPRIEIVYDYEQRRWEHDGVDGLAIKFDKTELNSTNAIDAFASLNSSMKVMMKLSSSPPSPALSTNLTLAGPRASPLTATTTALSTAKFNCHNPKEDVSSGDPTRLKQVIDWIFDNPSMSDIRIQVDGRELNAVRSILARSSWNYMSRQLVNAWKGKSVVQVHGYRYATYRAYLYYLYTDTIKLGKSNNLTELITLASDLEEVQLLKKLKQYCDDEEPREPSEPVVTTESAVKLIV